MCFDPFHTEETGYNQGFQGIPGFVLEVSTWYYCNKYLSSRKECKPFVAK